MREWLPCVSCIYTSILYNLHAGRGLSAQLQQTPNTEIQQGKWRFEALFLAGPALVAIAGVYVFWGVLFQLVQLFFSACVSISIWLPLYVQGRGMDGRGGSG